jgi:branched-chain amino acid transport system ATP-binding protein
MRRNGHVAAPRPEPVLELLQVVAGYGAIEVLHGVSLRVGRGEIVALIGANGAGKSTVAKLAGGELTPMRGCHHVGGRHVNGVPPHRLARAGVCSLPEGRGIFPNLTVAENLRLLTFSGLTQRAVDDATTAAFPVLADRRHQLAGTLSGGEQQMLAMARCVSLQPALLILDELSSGLAPQVIASLYEVVRELAQRGTGVLLVEQFTDSALAVADHVVVMVRGHVALEGAPATISAQQLSDAYLGVDERRLA